MNNRFSTRLIIVAVIVLILLVFFTLILGSAFKKKEVTTEFLTPIPTQSFETDGGNFSTLNPQQRQKDLNQFTQFGTTGLTSDQINSLNKLKSKLPYNSPDFDIGYSSDLNQFFISKKTGQADEKLQQFLQDNGLWDLFQSGASNFVVTNLPLNTAVDSSTQDILNQYQDSRVDHDPNHEYQNQPTITEESNPDLPTKSFSDFQNVMQTMFSYDTTGLNQAIDESNQVPTETPAPNPQPPPSKGKIIYPPNLGNPNSLGYYQMPEPLHNNYRILSCPLRRWGKRDLIGVIYTVALEWKQKNPGSLLQVGDLNGGPPHVSHRWGIAVDITVSDKSAADIHVGTRAKSIELAEMFVNTNLIKNIWYDDPVVDQAVRSYAAKNHLSLEQMMSIGHHDTHFHIDINEPKGPESAPDC